MNAYLVFAVGGPVLITSKYGRNERPKLVEKVKHYGKFVAFEVPFEMVKTNYSAHLEHIQKDPEYSEEFMVLDSDSDEIFTNIEFTGLRDPVIYEPGQ